MGVGPKPAASLPGRVHRRECPRAPRGRVAAVAGAASVPSTLPTCLSVGWLQASGAELYWEKEFVPEAPSAPELAALGLVFLAPPGPGSLPSSLLCPASLTGPLLLPRRQQRWKQSTGLSWRGSCPPWRPSTER